MNLYVRGLGRTPKQSRLSAISRGDFSIRRVMWNSICTCTDERIPNARETNHRKSEKRQACGKGAYESGRRVRTRGNASCPRRKARCAIHQTGDRHWSFQGPACWSGTSTAREGNDLRENPPQRHTCAEALTVREKAVGETLPCDSCCAPPRRPLRSIKTGAV